MRRSLRANPVRERGSVTPAAVAMVVVVTSIALSGVIFGSAVVARHRAQAGADLAALAAAGRLTAGRAAACSLAGSVAGAMHASLTECRVEALDVVVSVEVPANLGRWGLGTARAGARAGPSDTAG